MSSTKIIKYRRTPLGTAIKWIFILFNILMFAWLASYWADVIPHTGGNSAYSAGASIGSMFGTLMILGIWGLGAVILGMPVMLTRGDAVEYSPDDPDLHDVKRSKVRALIILVAVCSLAFIYVKKNYVDPIYDSLYEDSARNAEPELKNSASEIENDKDLPTEDEQYIENIELYELSAKYYQITNTKKLAGVDFKLKNNGNRDLSEVEVTVYFQDEEGNIIAEENFFPVLFSKYSYDKKPLKANYIWQQEKDKFLVARHVPSEWKEGAVTAKITDIKFLEE